MIKNGSPWKSLARKSTLPRIGSLVNMGRLILKAGDSWGDEPSSAGGGDGSGRDLEDSPGLMSWPAWRVGPSCVVSEALEKGPEVPSWSDNAEIPEAPQVW